MARCIRKCQARSPRTTTNDPLVKVEMPTKALDVFHKVPSGVGLQLFFCSLVSKLAAATASLVKENDVIPLWVKQLCHPLGAACTRATMQKYRWNARGVAKLFIVELKTIVGAELLRLQQTTCPVKASACAI